VAVNSFNEGVVSPLLSFWRRSLMLAGALFFTACSNNSSLPPFTASGFAEDQGAPVILIGAQAEFADILDLLEDDQLPARKSYRRADPEPDALTQYVE